MRSKGLERKERMRSKAALSRLQAGKRSTWCECLVCGIGSTGNRNCRQAGNTQGFTETEDMWSWLCRAKHCQLCCGAVHPMFNTGDQAIV